MLSSRVRHMFEERAEDRANNRADPEDKTKVTLVFGNIAEEDILLRRELEHLENTYPQRFRVSDRLRCYGE